MTNTKKWLTTAAVLTLSSTLAFAAPHDGHRGRHGRGGRGGDFSERFAKKLNLTEAQQQQIRDSQKSFRETNKSLFEAARATRQQMHAAKEAGDTAQLEALKGTAQAQRTQLKQLHEAQMQRIEALLTPEQRTQLQAMKAEREARRAQRGQNGEHGDRQ
jgi:Spy/CpxP family protein refolding chaperone